VGLGFVLLLAGCGASTPKMNPAQAKTGIDRAYGTVFNFSSRKVASKAASIQNGSSLDRALADALSSSFASRATGARVDGVELQGTTSCNQDALPSPCALVTYDLLGPNGSTLLSHSKGYAVFTQGKWLVAKSTICGLLELFYEVSGHSGYPPGC